jgi:ABC-2 type transport system permease protein
MRELKGLLGLWYRELLVFWREKSRIVSSLFSPILWLVVFGSGMGTVSHVGGVNYQTFLFPGILCMSVLFSSIFFGLYIVWDKRIDFFKEVLVAPLSRITIFTGKMLGGTTDSLIQGAILLSLGLFFGIHFSVFSVLAAMLILFLLSSALVSLGLMIGALMDSLEGFNLFVSFLIFPMFFFSGALFPLENLPGWLKFFTFIDPVTYAVDAMRGILLKLNRFPLGLDFLVLAGFAFFFISAGTLAFRKLK